MAEEADPRGGQETLKSVRPWGEIHILARNRMCSVDLTQMRSGQRSSLHSHQVRAELFG